MPIYEYRCRDCEHDFERLVPSMSSPPPPCPSCGAEEVKRRLSLFMTRSGAKATATAGAAPAPRGGGCCGGGCGCH
jgi:putative FmdB family regulatory protein